MAFRKLTIEGLRGILRAEVEGLRPLTLFLGPNGAGKSTLLEALGIVCSGGDAFRAFRALSTREWLGLGSIQYWLPSNAVPRVQGVAGPPAATAESPVREYEVTLGSGPPTQPQVDRARAEGLQGELVRFSASCQVTGSHAGLRMAPTRHHSHAVVEDGGFIVPVGHEGDAPETLPFSLFTALAQSVPGPPLRRTTARPSSKLRDALRDVKQDPGYSDFLGYLREVFPQLDSIETYPVGDDRNEPFIFERGPTATGARGYPLAYAGDGFCHALVLAATLANAKGGVAALDEPEAFAHPRLQGTLARLFRRALDDGTQVVIATHSLELVRATLAELASEPERVCVIGTMIEKGVLDPIVVDGPDAQRRVLELGDDLRL
jgi:energy-coupling factor transporter ATP-binding protein EcfA2